MRGMGKAFLLEQRLIVWSAHEFATSAEAFRDLSQLIEGCPELDRRVDAAALLDLAGRLGWLVRLGRVTIVCGVAASGKSTVAGALAERSGASALSSDLIRKELLGVDSTDRAPASAYTRNVNSETYARLGGRAAERLANGERVIVDATFRFRADRRAFAEALGKRAPEALWVQCHAPAETLLERADLQADCRLRDSELIRGLGEAPALDDCTKGGELLRIHKNTL